MCENGTRRELGSLQGRRLRFRGFFVRHGHKAAYRGAPLTTLLFRGVCLVENGEQVTDHLWFTWTKGFEALGPLKEGDCVEFDARATSYEKGYWGHREDVIVPASRDWRLSYPTKIARNIALDSPLPKEISPQLESQRIVGIGLKTILRHGYEPNQTVPKKLAPVTCKKTQLAAAWVCDWAKQPGRTEEEIEQARKYLQRWPKGPQI